MISKAPEKSHLLHFATYSQSSARGLSCHPIGIIGGNLCLYKSDNVNMKPPSDSLCSPDHVTLAIVQRSRIILIDIPRNCGNPSALLRTLFLRLQTRNNVFQHYPIHFLVAQFYYQPLLCSSKICSGCPRIIPKIRECRVTPRLVP